MHPNTNTTITIPMTELKPALTGLGKVIARRVTLPVIGCVKVDRDEKGQILLTGTNLDLFVTAGIDRSDLGEPASVLVPFRDLVETAKLCGKTDSIVISVISSEENKSGPSIMLTYPIGSATAERRCDFIPADEFPVISKVAGKTVPISDSVRRSIQEAIGCASDDPTRHVINSAYIDVSDPKCHCVVGTDGSHLYMSNSFKLPLAGSVVLPHHPFLTWKEFGQEQWFLAADPADPPDPQAATPGAATRLFQLSTDHWRLIGRQVDAAYPNWRQVVPGTNDWKTRVELQAESLDEIVRTIDRMPCPDQRWFSIGLEISGARLSLVARNAGSGSDTCTRIAVDSAKVVGRPVRICLNRRFLTKALRLGLNAIHIVDEMEPLRFSEGGRQMIVMPLRPDVSATAATSQTASASPAPAASPEEESSPAAPANVETSDTETKPASAPPTPETEPEAPSTERTDMVNDPTTTTAAEETAPTSEIDTVLEVVEDLRESLTVNLADLKSVTGKLKQIQRDQKSTEREMQSFRQTLKTLQGVKL